MAKREIAALTETRLTLAAAVRARVLVLATPVNPVATPVNPVNPVGIVEVVAAAAIAVVAGGMPRAEEVAARATPQAVDDVTLGPRQGC